MRAWIAIGTVLLLPAFASAEDFTRLVSVDSPGRLLVELDRGDVEVSTHTRPVLRLEATARGVGASAVRFRLREAGKGLLVFEGRSEGWISWLRSGPRVAVRLLVPRTLTVDVKTSGRVVARDSGIQLVIPVRGDAPITLPPRR